MLIYKNHLALLYKDVLLNEHLPALFCLERDMEQNILIIDDDPLTIRLCQNLLEKKSMKVRSLESPENILQELEQHKADIILLDYCMPHTNGLDAYKTIRQIYSPSEIQIIFMTGSMDQEVLSKIRDETSIEPILKPINPIDFATRVSTALIKI